MLGGMATRKKHRRVSYLLREEEGRFCARALRAPSVLATLLSRWDPPLSGIGGGASGDDALGMRQGPSAGAGGANAEERLVSGLVTLGRHRSGVNSLALNRRGELLFSAGRYFRLQSVLQRSRCHTRAALLLVLPRLRARA
jgi:hypothetical protein